MNDLIKIEERDGKQTVNARDLHEFLEVGRDFTSWIKQRVKKYGFVEDQDFTIVFTKSGENLGGRPSSEYHISLDMAKELSMVENNDKGREARKYFIDVENKLRNVNSGVDYRLIGEMIAVAIKEAFKENISVTTEQKAIPGPQMSKRDQLRRLITQYSHENGHTQRESWGFLYESAYYILHVNIRSRANNRGMQKIDYIEEAGLLDDCIAIMKDEVA